LILLTSTNFLVVLGVGNSVRMDDGAGIRVVEKLESDVELNQLDISFRYLNTGGFDILDEIDGFQNAIIIDAASMADKGLKPGEFFHLTDIGKMKSKPALGVSSHGLGVLSVLKYADIGGYEIPESIEIYGIQVKTTNYFSEELTPEVALGVQKLVKQVKKRILSLF